MTYQNNACSANNCYSRTQGSTQYSGIEYSRHTQTEDSTYLTNLTFSSPEQLYFSPSSFLNPLRPEAQHISEENKPEIMLAVEETFQKLTNEQFPKDQIIISICPKETLKQWHELSGGTWSDGIMGFALNSNANGNHRVFAREGPKDEVLLTLGHEIGHVMTPTLGNAHDEEAKAFAFSLAWMNCIIENNIAGMSTYLNPQPAKNGLHNTAYEFVQYLMSQGKTALQAFIDIAAKATSIIKQPEIIQQ